MEEYAEDEGTSLSSNGSLANGEPGDSSQVSDMRCTVTPSSDAYQPCSAIYHNSNMCRRWRANNLLSIGAREF